MQRSRVYGSMVFHDSENKNKSRDIFYIYLIQTACLVVNPIMVGNFAFLFNCTPVGRTLDSMSI